MSSVRATVRHFVFALVALSLASLFLSSCGGGGGSSSGTGGGSAPPIDLTTTTTTIAVDNSVPSATSDIIAEVVSSADSEPLGQPLSIPTSSTGFATPVFALDSNQDLLLAAYASSSQTTLGASSTATTLAILTLGTLPSPGPSFAQVAQDVQSAPGFQTLIADIVASLADGTSPLTSQSVVQDVATVVNQVLPVIISQSGSLKASRSGALTASRVRFSPKFGRPRADATQTTEFAGPPLPFQILGPSLPNNFFSVYIASATAQGGVSLANKMPIALHATSTDQSGNTIDAGEVLPAASLWSQLTTPSAVAVKGNGQTFVVNVDETDPTTQMTNIRQIIADWLIFLVGQATNLGTKQLPNLETCAAQGSAQIISAVGNANTTIFVSTATGAQVGASLASGLTIGLISGTVKTLFACAAPGVSSTAVAAAAIANLAELLSPLAGAWEDIKLVASASGPLTEEALTLYYWNNVQPVQVCEAGGDVVSCIQGTTWNGNITWSSGVVTPVSLGFSSQGAVGTYGPIGAVEWTTNGATLYGWISGTSVNLALGNDIPPGQPCSYTLTGSLSGNTMSGNAQSVAGTCNGLVYGNASGTFSVTEVN